MQESNSKAPGGGNTDAEKAAAHFSIQKEELI
jgi:hypothetical protein